MNAIVVINDISDIQKAGWKADDPITVLFRLYLLLGST